MLLEEEFWTSYTLLWADRGWPQLPLPMNFDSVKQSLLRGIGLTLSEKAIGPSGSGQCSLGAYRWARKTT